MKPPRSVWVGITDLGAEIVTRDSDVRAYRKWYRDSGYTMVRYVLPAVKRKPRKRKETR